MHHFLYPSYDTYITNESNYLNKNLGLDEILEVKGITDYYQQVTHYQTSSISQSYSVNTTLINFTGSVDGYLSGSSSTSSLLVSSSIDITGSFRFNGIFTGSWNGNFTTASMVNVSGSLSGSAVGSLTGSWRGYSCDSSGSVIGYTGYIQGIAIGTGSYYFPVTRISAVPSISRALLKFNVSSLSSSIFNGDVENTASLKCVLNMSIDKAVSIPLSYSVYAYPISQSWEAGNGYYETGGSSLGASWYYRNYNSGSLWYSIDSSSNYNTNVDYLNTSSYSSASFQKGGGTWHYFVPASYLTSSTGFCAGLTPTQSLKKVQNFNYESSDISMDITDIFKSWVCGCIPNEGIIVMSSLELIQTENETGTLKFFSKDTNTIYVPYIDVYWDDSSYVTGSLIPVQESVPYTITIKNLSKNYKFGAIPRINVFAREKNPLKNFNSGFQLNQYVTSSLLPTSSYYCIKDNESERTIIDFDIGTKLSCDGNIHYFYIDTTSFAVERYYRILIKIVTENEEQIIDNGYIFKVTR